MRRSRAGEVEKVLETDAVDESMVGAMRLQRSSSGAGTTIQ